MPLRPGDYFRQLASALSGLDFALLAVKTLAFGFIIALVTCYHGLAQPLRLEEVSRATVAAVAQSVIACVLIDALFIIIYLADVTDQPPAQAGPPAIEMTGVAVSAMRDPDTLVAEGINWTVNAGDYWVVAGLHGVGQERLPHADRRADGASRGAGTGSSERRCRSSTRRA